MESVLTENATTVVVVLLALIFFVGIAATSLIFYNRHTAKFEPKADPKLHKEYATKDELAKVEIRLEKLSQEMDQGFCAIRTSSAQSREKIYTSIRDVEKEVSALAKADEIRGGRINEISVKLDKILERL